jgi:hypothetical protein
MGKDALSGVRFGLWTVLGVVRGKGALRRVWCRCECGTERDVIASNLTRGISKGCGCTRAHKSKHGQSRRGAKTPEYAAWKGMKSRCKPEYKQAQDYYLRGIRVCDRWRLFENFFADMGPKPDPAFSLDRIDNDGPYSPDNCRWTDYRTQRLNSRRRIDVKLDGETLNLQDAAIQIGVTPSAIYQERKRKNVTFQEAFDMVKNRQ